MKIHKPSPEDFPIIANIINSAQEIYKTILTDQEFIDSDFGTETKDTISELNSSRNCYVYENENNEIIGFLAFYAKNKSILWVSMLFVDPKNQRSDTGSQLIKYLENYCKKNNYKAILLETPKHATWAINFYQKNNYKILTDIDLEKDPYNNILGKPQSAHMYIFGKIT